jgi:hypothetical protein
MSHKKVPILFGCLGVLVVTSIVFWQMSPDIAPDENGEGPLKRGDGYRGEGGSDVAGRAGRPVVLASPGDESRGKVAGDASAEKSPAGLMHDTIASFSGMKPDQRNAAVTRLIDQLRQQGPAGLQAVRDYLRAGQDVSLGGGYMVANGKVTMSPSLRHAMLNALGDWPGNESLQITREVMGSTTRLSDVGILIQQLESKSPGTFKAEAIEIIQKLASMPQQQGDAANIVIEALRHFKAPELIPAAEQLAQNNVRSAIQVIQALGDLPQDVRGAAVERLFANPDVARQIAGNPKILRGLSYKDPAVAGNVARLFSENMEVHARANFLGRLTEQPLANVSTGFSSAGFLPAYQVPDPETHAAELKARLALLDRIAPQCMTAALQGQWQGARDAIHRAMANLAAPGRGVVQ